MNEGFFNGSSKNLSDSDEFEIEIVSTIRLTVNASLSDDLSEVIGVVHKLGGKRSSEGLGNLFQISGISDGEVSKSFKESNS